MLKLRLNAIKIATPRPRRVVKYGVVLAVVAYLLYVFAGPNAHAVIDGRVYRTAQLSGAKLSSYLKEKQIRTVINLRGHCPDFDWYREEAEACAAAGVCLEDITFSANRLPPPTELKRLLEVLDRTEYPILLHCKQGADRTGLASAVVLLLYTDASLDRAKRELWPYRGHFRIARTMAMDDFFDRYEAWLAGEPHTPAKFRDWAMNHYTPGPAMGKLELVSQPERFTSKPFALTVKATNQSQEAWRFKAGATAGLQLQYRIFNDAGEKVHDDAAGLMNRTVPPGESIDLMLAVPGLAPGSYTLRAEMADFEGAAVPVRARFFYQFGSDALHLRFTVK